MALTAPKGPRWTALDRFAPAVLAPLAYETYLRAATGTWNAWMTANAKGWGLHLAWPWLGARETWRAAFEHTQSDGYAFLDQIEFATMLAALAGVLVLLWLRNWPEALYVGLMFGALACSTWWASTSRGALLAFPLFAVLARGPRWLGGLYVAVCGPLAVIVATLFLSGRWSG
jgi:hypothetical protein